MRAPSGALSRSSAAMGSNPHPLFDTVFYLERNPDVAAAGGNPLEHYLAFGVHEGRSPFADGVWG